MVTEKLFALGLLILVCGYIWWMSPASSTFVLGLSQIGQCRPLKDQNLGFWLHFGPLLNYSGADMSMYMKHIYVFYKHATLKPSASFLKVKAGLRT